MPEEKNVLLRYKAGGSDKDYQVHLLPEETGWVVNFEYGRHGHSMQAGTKTAEPVTYESAEKIYNDVVKKQMAKGYTESGTGKVYAGTEKEEKVSGLLPQLLNFIDEEALEKFFKDDDFIMQEKKDGRRIIIRRKGSKVEAINRKGLVVALHEDVLKDIKDLMVITSKKKDEPDLVLDGEMIGNNYYVFDMLYYLGDMKYDPYSIRYESVDTMIGSYFPGDHVIVVTAYEGEEAKRKAFNRIREEGGEGVVFKNKNAPYTVGRPNSWKGAPQTKFKFYATAVCRVGLPTPNKRSVDIFVGGSKLITHVGKVTIPPNYDIPKEGQLVEIRYLYAYPNGGSLYQPIYQGVRDDVDEADTYDTLKFKQGSNDDEEE